MSAGWELCVVMAPVLMLLVLTTATAKLVQTLTNSKVHVDVGRFTYIYVCVYFLK